MNTNLNDLPSVLTVEELAAVLRIGKNSAYELVNSGHIKSVRCGHMIRIPKAALEAFVSSESEETA